MTLNQFSRTLKIMAKSGQTHLDGIEGISLTRQDVDEIIERYEKVSGEAGKVITAARSGGSRKESAAA